VGAIVVGIALIALGLYDYRRNRVPADAIRVPGTVVDLSVRRARSSGRSKVRQYAPIVAYRHPETGRREELPPEPYGSRRHEVGDDVEVAFSPSTGRVARVPEHPWLALAVLFAVGFLIIGVQIAIWIR
jgi:hypothetical protein